MYKVCLKSFRVIYQNRTKHIDLESLSFPWEEIPFEKDSLIQSRKSADLVVGNLCTSLPGHDEEKGPLRN